MSPQVKFNMDDRAYQKMIEQKKLDGFRNKSFKYYFEWMFKPVVIHPTITQAIQRATKSELAPMWMKNLADNLPRIRASSLSLRDLLPEEQQVKKKCVVLGRGPSMFNKGHLDMIRDSKLYRDGELVVVSCDGALKDALNVGIVPDYVTGVDGSEVCTKWYTDLDPKDLIKENGETMKAVMATQVSKAVMDQLHDLIGEENIYWFMPASDDIEQDQSVTLRLTLMTKGAMPDGVSIMDCGGNVGTLSWIFTFNVLKHQNICLIGMDCGYPEDMPMDETYYWESTYSSIEALKRIEYTYQFHNPYFDEKYWYDPVFRSYRESFYEMVLKKPDWLDLYNASSGTLYYPPFIKAIHLELWLEGKE